MTWRTTQLSGKLCDQDRLLLGLFKTETVKYVGHDNEFKKHLTCDQNSSNLVLILNKPMWVSEIVNDCNTHLSDNIKKFYIGINRYFVLGNDTTICVANAENRSYELINLITSIVNTQGFTVLKSGQHDQDCGRYFNFVQPLTWVYGYKSTD